MTSGYTDFTGSYSMTERIRSTSGFTMVHMPDGSLEYLAHVYRKTGHFEDKIQIYNCCRSKNVNL